MAKYVTSADGTRIAFEKTGSGPALVLVHGSINDHNVWGRVMPALAARFTVYAMDRRGRGESGAPAEHAMERQFEDVVAVMEEAGEPVHLLGHSFGAHCALGAAAMAPERVQRLVLYEPPTPNPRRLDVALNFETMDPSDALALFLATVGLSEDEIRALRATPFWSYLASFAPTMPPEGRALIASQFDASRFRVLRMPALFLVGSKTKEQVGEVLRQLAAYMPHARWHEFEGEGHSAMLTAPGAFAAAVVDFLAE